MRIPNHAPDNSHDTIQKYKEGLVLTKFPVHPTAFISTLTTDRPIEFASIGKQHHFNLQLTGCVETYRVAGKHETKRLVVPGHLSFIPASEPLRVRVQPVRRAQSLHCSLPVQWMSKVREQDLPFSGRHLNRELNAEMGTWSAVPTHPAARIVDALSAPQSMLRLRMDSLFLELAVQLWQAGRPISRLTTRERLSMKKLRTVIDYLEENLGCDVSLEELADICQLSAFHFARAFRAAVGVAPWRYLCALRIWSARRWLTSSDLTVTELALRLGYSSSSHFGSAFRSATGLTPTAFRQAAQSS